MPLVFTVERWRQIAEHRELLHATLVRGSESVVHGAVRRVWRESMAHDEDGNEVGLQRKELETVITVALTYGIDVYAAAGISQELARACGFKTASLLREAWQRSHPRSPLALAVWFRLGDHRDQPRYLTSTRSMRWGPSNSSWRTRPAKPTKKRPSLEKSGVGDYTGNPRIACDDAEVLTEAEFAVMTAHNGQRQVRRELDVESRYAGQSLSQRLARIEAGGDIARQIARRELAVITQRTARAERRIAAA